MNNQLKFNQIFTYGLPGLPLAMLGLPLFVYLPSYYSQNLGLSLATVGIALLLARSLDVITDPLIGLLNDLFPKFRSVLWRRQSYMIAGVPLLLVGLNFLLRPAEDVTALYLFLWSFITYFGWTLINIPWLALGAELTQDYNNKSTLASSREIFAVIGTVTVISLPVILSIQSDLQSTLHIIATLLTFLIPVSLIPLFWSLKTWKITTPKIIFFELEPSKSNTNNGSETDLNRKHKVKRKSKLFTKELINIIKNPAIKKLLPAYFINSIANALPATLFILFVTHVLQTPEQIGVLLITYFLSAIAGIPLWLYVAKKTDKHTSWCVALIGAILSFIWVPFLSAGDFYPFLLICLSSGFFLGADVVMPASIQADISQHIVKNSYEEDYSIYQEESANRIKSRLTILDNTQNRNSRDEQKNSTALLFGLWGLLTKLSLALAVGIAFPLLDMAGLETNMFGPQTVNENATMTLIILYALIPVFFKIWVLFQMWRFPYGKYFFSSLETSTIEGNDNENTKTATTNCIISNISTFKRV